MGNMGNELYSSICQHIEQGHENAALLREFMVLMSVCHTVIPEQMSDGTIQYHASSPGMSIVYWFLITFAFILKHLNLLCIYLFHR